ncbi:hypothetical protein BCR42DRAFT_493442 [Absidia repens]|uniref:C2H2-type domain-containing protein n=1 Tax=Absidia repens TaxID=90262 RepID=A0A1X2IA91_9FUNG|nr:hypothetical protein BCR42DRAFT_493442 [Absidia repens]
MIDSGSTLQPHTEELVCHWNECLRTFAGHDALGHHLSEEHIGWKRGEYCCEWTNCSRKGVKCHNRFALIMHLRIHTQEKPFECDVDGCGMNFGRLDALTRHKKAEHGIDTQGNPTETQSNKTTSVKMEIPRSQPRKQHATREEDAYKLAALSRGLNKKRKMVREEDHSEKHKRGRLDNPDSDLGDYGDVDLQINSATVNTQQKQQQQQRHTSSSSALSSPSSTSLSPQNKYKIAKAKLQYILRENEMLSDEWTAIQRRLTRLQTERRVLLDALMSAEDDQDGDLLSTDDEDDPLDGLDTSDKQGEPGTLMKERILPVGTQS